MDDDIRFTRADVERVIQEALKIGWQMGRTGSPEPLIMLEWIDDRPKIVPRDDA